MKIQKFILTLATLLAAGSAAAAGLKTSPEYTSYPGSTCEMSVKAELPQGTTALQFTVSVPAPCTSAAIRLNSEAAPDHTLQMHKEGENTYNYVVYSNANTPFTEAAAARLFTLDMPVSPDASRGDYSVRFSKVVASDAAGVETRLPDMDVPFLVRIAVTSVTVAPQQTSVILGEEVKLAVTVAPATAEQDVTWEVSDSKIVSVDNTGLVRGLSVGTTRVTARSTAFPSITGYCDVTVNPVTATAISLDKENVELRMGSNATLTATVSPANTTNPAVAWSSSDSGIVSVDDKGVITAVKPGEATVTVSTTDGSSLKASCKVKVLPPLATAVTLSKTSLDLTVKATAVLTATVSPAEASQAVQWSSSDAKVATVAADGTVTAVAPGAAVITATTTDGSGVKATCAVIVTEAKVSSITLDKTALGLRIGQTETIVATVLPDYAGNRRLDWTSDNPAVATVDANGKVTAVALGEANVTAVATDGSGVKASCKVTVTNALATGVTLDITEATLRVRESVKLTATVTPEGAVNAVNWSSNAPEVASVDAQGNVSALAAGKAIITATTADGTNLTATCAITVDPALVESVTLDRHELTMTVGESETLNATVLPDYAGNQAVVWESSASDVAIVDSNGRVIALAEGTAVITATAADGSGASDQCTVTVERVKASSIAIDPQEISIEQEKTVQVKSVVLPAEAVQDVQWSSLNPDIATVDAEGNITGVEVGTTVVSAATTDGSDLTASCLVTVTEADGIFSVTCDSMTVVVENGTEIIIQGLPYDEPVMIVDVAGTCVYAGMDRRISGLGAGMYIIIAHGAKVKVILR
ncbi:MAG: Ig-like domain-containing protein [Muribaculaceae bacterium]|nr:Ig-like domain-containing protein [Muribaculaceae bacterium]